MQGILFQKIGQQGRLRFVYLALWWLCLRRYLAADDNDLNAVNLVPGYLGARLLW